MPSHASGPLRLAALQASAASNDVARNLATLTEALEKASVEEAKLLVAPELFLTGYRLDDAALALAEPADGPSCEALTAAVERTGVSLVYGFVERAGADLYNAANLLTPDAGRAATYRKTHLFGDAESAVFAAGNRLEVVPWRGLGLGMLICYDVEFPETVRTLASRGADLVAVPTANMTPFFDVPITLVRARAAESGVAVVYANLVGTEPPHTFTGQSAIVDPLGRDAARAGEEPCLLVTEIDLIACRSDPTHTTQLADRRFDLYDATSATGMKADPTTRNSPIAP
ncbi:MAG: carbon-nitrogen hydrolase family protein [Phycisphaeraceae bacterium]